MVVEQTHSTGDEAFSHLSTNQGVGGDLVRSFPGSQASESSNWLDMWFQARIEKHHSDNLSKSETILPFDPPPTQVQAVPLARPIKLKSLQARYFRGFREALELVNMAADFIVIEGRNSSGKTSLAEALEWLFADSLSRREPSSGGNSRELEQCITNQFRPDGADTWVSGTFVIHSDEADVTEFNLRRVLKEDYGRTANAILQFCPVFQW